VASLIHVGQCHFSLFFGEKASAVYNFPVLLADVGE
jgi:hypothetical protein